MPRTEKRIFIAANILIVLAVLVEYAGVRISGNPDIPKAVPKDLAVFLIDINGLKTVNDSIGHEAGDELICGAAACIETTIGNGGQTFRIGGDEFVVFAAMTHRQLMSALQELAHKTQIWSGTRVDRLSLSVGHVLA